MAESSTTVIDCRKQCRKFEMECLSSGKSNSECREERRRCDKACVFK